MCACAIALRGQRNRLRRFCPMKRVVYIAVARSAHAVDEFDPGSAGVVTHAAQAALPQRTVHPRSGFLRRGADQRCHLDQQRVVGAR